MFQSQCCQDLSTYSMEPEYVVTPGDCTIGVYCHEYGHVLGLPDLYDSSDGILPEQRRWVVGCWGLMAAGSWDINRINAAGGGKVVWEDTRNQGSWRGYSRLHVPWGGFRRLDARIPRNHHLWRSERS